MKIEEKIAIHDDFWTVAEVWIQNFVICAVKYNSTHRLDKRFSVFYYRTKQEQKKRRV